MEAEIKFEPEGRTGVIATGTYLYDAAKRLGVRIPECERRGETDLCAVKVESGKNLLSEPTKAELETLGSDRFIQGERLACQAKIEGAGEIIIMAKEKKEEKSAEEEAKENESKKVEDFRKEFDEMPLEKKIAALLQLEAVTLGETFSFVLNSPFKIVEKVMDVMAEFGFKLEKDEKDAKRPEEHKTNGDGSGSGKSKKKSEKKESAEQTANEEESIVEAVETPENSPESEKSGDGGVDSKAEEQK